jgi:DNA-binding CsgD family transcriptional regulator
MNMAQLDIEALSRISDALTQGKRLTPAERVELLRIAQGFACKDSASSANVSPETIRARRKRIYRKLGLAGAGETLSSLLALALAQLAPRSAAAQAPGEMAQRSAAAGAR